MRVGLIAPPWIAVPPLAYGGTEAVVADLARGLTDLGHDVVLFTVGDSTCPVTKRHLFDSGVAPIGQTVPELAHVLAAYESLADCDVIHDHTILGPVVAGTLGGAGPPVVTTHHGLFDSQARRIFTAIAERAAIVAISRDQAGRAGSVPITAVIHHGVDLDVYRPSAEHGDYLVFIGRMSADKGPHRAVRIARAAGRPLRLVSKMVEQEERDYFATMVRPLLSREDEMPDELPLAERVDVLAHAAALLNPIAWDEPFGLVMAEALATATPVIATPRGAAPEIVTHQQTGYLVGDEGAAVEAAADIDTIDRQACRADAERRFSARRMAEDYLAVYERVLSRPDCPPGPVAGRIVPMRAPISDAPEAVAPRS